MSLIERVVLSIVRRPFYTIMLLCVIVASTLMMMVGNIIEDTINAYHEQLVKAYGYSIWVGDTRTENRTNARMSQELIQNILDMDHVEGYNTSLFTECIPADFKNVPYQTGNARRETENSDFIYLIANTNYPFYLTFRNQTMVLKEGAYPTQNNPGVLVDCELAKQNHLKTGSLIHIYDEENQKQIGLKVVGTYLTKEAPKQKMEADNRTYYVPASNSYVFCDVDSWEKIGNIEDQMLHTCFYVDQYKNIDEVCRKIENMPGIREGYHVMNYLENAVSSDIVIFQTLQKSSEHLLKITFISMVTIVFLLTWLWMKSHDYNAGVYIALGVSKIEILLYFVCEAVIISMAAFAVSVLTGYLLMRTSGSEMAAGMMNFLGITFRNGEIGAYAIENIVSISSLIKSAIISAGTALLATVLSVLAILRRHSG